MKILEIKRARLAALLDQRAAAHAELEELPTAAEAENRALNPDETARSGELIAQIKGIDDDVDSLRSEIAELEQIAERTANAAKAPAPAFHRQPDPVATLDVRNMSRDQVRDAAMRSLDDASWARDDLRSNLEKAFGKRSQKFDGNLLARRLLLTESDEYRSAFLKGITGQADTLTERERQAVTEVRAMAAGTDTAGGYGVPVLIDPTVLISTGTGLTGLLNYCRIENINTDEWKGVSAAATSWSYDTEGSEVSDDASTFSQPSVPLYMARGFVPASIEATLVYPGIATEIGSLLEAGYMDLVASKLAVGTGSSQPKGWFTALDANTNVEVVVTTDGAFGAVDIDKVWASLGEKFRSRAIWFMNVDVENEIRAFGSGSATSRFTVDQTAEGISRLNGKPVVLSDYAPLFTGTTGASNLVIVGDPTTFLFAQRVGMTVEFIQNVVSGSNGRPTGQRAWFAYAFHGCNSVLDTGARLLQNQ